MLGFIIWSLIAWAAYKWLKNYKPETPLTNEEKERMLRIALEGIMKNAEEKMLAEDKTKSIK